MAIVLLFYKHSSLQNSEWMNEISKNGIDAALSKFVRQIPVSKKTTNACSSACEPGIIAHVIKAVFVNLQVTPAKFLRTAFGIRGLSSAYISRVFLRTEMALKSRSVLTGSRSLARSRSTDNLPTSQSQVNIQMMSHTLTIREVRYSYSYFLYDGAKRHIHGEFSSTQWTHVHAELLIHSIWLLPLAIDSYLFGLLIL